MNKKLSRNSTPHITFRNDTMRKSDPADSVAGMPLPMDKEENPCCCKGRCFCQSRVSWANPEDLISSAFGHPNAGIAKSVATNSKGNRQVPPEEEEEEEAALDLPHPWVKVERLVCIAQQQQPSFLLTQAAGPTVPPPHTPSPSCSASSSTYQLTYNFCINSNFEHKLREPSLPAWFGIWSLPQPAVSCCLWIQK